MPLSRAQRPAPATFEELIKFHSEDYMRFLRTISPDNMAVRARAPHSATPRSRPPRRRCSRVCERVCPAVVI